MSLIKVSFTILALLLLTGQKTEDNISGYIRKNSVPFLNPASPDKRIFEQIKKFKVITIGEIHGTNEAPRLTRGIVNLFLQNNKKVVLGLELPQRWL